MSTNMDRRLCIAQLVDSFHIGGGELQCLSLVRGLRETHDVHVGALRLEGPLLADFRAIGIEPCEFRLGNSFAHPRTIQQALRLARWLRQIRADVVHAHDFYTEMIAVPAARLAGCRSIVGRLDLAHWHGKARHALLAAITRAADHAIGNAEAVMALMRAERVNARHTTLIRNGIDLAAFDSRFAQPPDTPLPEERPVAVIVANMRHEVKRQEDFIKALALLRRKRADVHGWIVGEGSRQHQLEGFTAQLGLSGAIHFLGRRGDVPSVLRHATLAVLCSQQEGLSNAVIEGMAARRPMVVTDAGGNRELVADGQRGFVVPVRNPQALSEAMLAVFADPVRAQSMGAAGREFVERELTLDRMVGAHELLYRSLSHTRLASGEERGRPCAAASGQFWT